MKKSVRTELPRIASRQRMNKLRTAVILLFILGCVATSSTLMISAFAGSTKKKKARPQLTVKADSRFKRNDTEKLLQRKISEGRNKTRQSKTARNALDGPFFQLQPTELRLVKAREFTGDLRNLPKVAPVRQERPEREGPTPGLGGILPGGPQPTSEQNAPITGFFPPAPAAIQNFIGLDFFNWGAGRPPDTNGDVGPNHYIESVNTSIGIFNKTGGLITALTFNTFMSQGAFGNLCDTNNFGDPVVLYDSFEDRWIITDFAFTIDGGGNITSNAYQCFAASKTDDPVAGGWNFYSIVNTDLLNDYPKFGIWPDGLYMSANMFGFPAGSSFANVRVWAFNKAQMYAGNSSVQVVTFNAPRVADGGTVFTLLPSNARLQTGTPPIGTPNFFASMFAFTNAMSVWKFHVDWNSISTSTFTGPFYSFTPTTWASPPSTVPSQGGNNNDTLGVRFMMQNQYSNFSGIESLWNSHTIRGSVATQAAVRYYQVNVTGGSVAANSTQAATHNPDADHRYMPSVAVDRAGNMALGYSVSNSTLFPAIRYAGRLASDPLDTLPQTETSLIAGTGSQNTSTRWGDYSTMTLDPDGCTFWFTNEYYAVTGNNWQTRIGSFRFPSPQCTTVSSGTISGTVTAATGGAPISGATVALGSRTATTNGSGVYTFTAIPSGTYPSETASKPGFNSGSATNIVVTDGMTTTSNFSLTTAAGSGCFVDTSQADFQMGVPTQVDLTASPGNVILLNSIVDQQNTTLGGFGFGITTTNWGGQTFTPAATGNLTKADINLFCSGCSGTPQDLTLSVRATSGGLPTGPDLASTTILGFLIGSSAYYTGTFASPPTLTAGTMYALVIRPNTNPTGTYALTRSGTSGAGANVYTGGTLVLGASSGTTWSTPLIGGTSSDAGFRTYMTIAASGNQVSSLKDANPTPPNSTFWSTMTWNATVPANTTLRFQVAGSNNPSGPFNFVGPDGTAASFFVTSPAWLGQFNGNRYLKYKAYLSTTDSTVTPTLNDVSVCFALPTAASARIAGRITDDNGSSIAGVAVNLSGGSLAVTVTDSLGNYHFDSVATDAFYSVTPSLANFHFNPSQRSFSLLGSNLDAAFVGTPDAVVTANAIDTTEFFVRQQYVDFLGREPDEGGFNYWSEQINGCGADAQCIRTRRVDVSAAFFIEREFQQTASFVYRLYKGGLGRQLNFAEYAVDRQQVVAGPGLDASKQAFTEAFVSRAEFTQRYQSNTTAASFVDALLQTVSNSGVDLSSERSNLIGKYNDGHSLNESRALALRAVAENQTLAQAVYNQSFVLTQYFSYLRRDPDQGGFDFWLNVLNNRQPGNYRGMVCAFLTSTEYQRRFGVLVTRSNADCGR